jgi:hypothetical protein
VDYAAENQGVLYVLGVSLPLASVVPPRRGSGCSLPFMVLPLAGKIIKSSTAILHAELLKTIEVNHFINIFKKNISFLAIIAYLLKCPTFYGTRISIKSGLLKFIFHNILYKFKS